MLRAHGRWSLKAGPATSVLCISGRKGAAAPAHRWIGTAIDRTRQAVDVNAWNNCRCRRGRVIRQGEEQGRAAGLLTSNATSTASTPHPHSPNPQNRSTHAPQTPLMRSVPARHPLQVPGGGSHKLQLLLHCSARDQWCASAGVWRAGTLAGAATGPTCVCPKKRGALARGQQLPRGARGRLRIA